MTIDEAIEYLTSIGNTKAFNNRPDEEQAVKLGAEALKRINTMRGYCSPGSGPLLPGETK